MTNVWVVHADLGRYASHFIRGGYVGGGWISGTDLTAIENKKEIRAIYSRAEPHLKPRVLGAYVGQAAIFLLGMKAGDYVITPSRNRKLLNYGQLSADPSYFYSPNDSDGCPFPHRRRVEWAEKQLVRSELTIPFQNTLRAAKTAFRVPHVNEFLQQIGQGVPGISPAENDPYRLALKQILEFNAYDFELLVKDLLAASGFEQTKHTGKPNDDGVDVTGELNVSNLATMKVLVQAKRYATRAVSAREVKQLRSSIPRDGQGVFITTSDYQNKAKQVADDRDFPRINLIDGRRLVDLLAEYWSNLSEEWRDRLGSVETLAHTRSQPTAEEVIV